MLHALRAFARTWVAKILLGVLIVSFAAFGINNVIADLGSSTVARVGDEEITVREFQRAYNSELNRVAQQIGQVPTPDMAMQLGIPSSVIQGLAAEAAISALGRSLNLGVSEDQLGRLLRADPNFAGLLGGFDRSTFSQRLRQMGMTESEYFEQLASDARRAQIATSMFVDAKLPQAGVDLLARYLGDQRTVDYIVLNEAALPVMDPPTEEELAAYLTANQEQFRTAETRTVEVLVLTPEVLADETSVTDAEVAAEYERTKASLTTVERRQIRQVALRDDATVTAFETALAAGRSFDDIVAELALTPTDLGSLGQTQVADAALATAAFGLTEGQTVIIDGATGKRAVNVSAITPGGTMSLADATPQIRQQLAVAKARNQFADVLDQIEELRGALQPLSQIAGRFGLETQTVTVTAAGPELAAVPGIPAEQVARVSQAIFSAQPDRMAPTIVISANYDIWFDLLSVDPARDRTLDEVRDAVSEAVTAQKTSDAMAAEVETITARLAGGESIDDVAIAYNLFPQFSAPMGRTGDGTPVINETVADAIFSGGMGHFGSALNGDGDYVVFQVTDVTPATVAPDPQIVSVLENDVRDGLFNEFVSGIRDQAGLRINQQVLSSLLSPAAAL